MAHSSANLTTRPAPRREGGTGRGLAAAAATGDLEALRRAFEAKLAQQEQRHAAGLRAAALGDAKFRPGSGQATAAEAGATRVPGGRRRRDDEDVFAGPTTDESGPPAGVARAIAAARALPEHRRHGAYAVDLCLAEHAGGGRLGRARVAVGAFCGRRTVLHEEAATKDAVAVLERARADRGRRRRRREFVGLCAVERRLRARVFAGGRSGAARPPDDDGPGEFVGLCRNGVCRVTTGVRAAPAARFSCRSQSCVISKHSANS